MGKIRFYTDATKVGMPFININEGGFQNASMLIDTGSTENMLFGYVYQQAKDQLKEIDGDYVIRGIDGNEKKGKCVVGTVPFCGKCHEMSFLVREDDDCGLLLSKELGFNVIGIIGTFFMVEHGWTIDFAKQEIVIPDYDIWPEDFLKVKNQKRTQMENE